MQFKAVILILITLTLSVSFAEELRIAHVDSKLIFQKFRGTQKAQAEYDRQVARWEQQANILQQELASIRERLEKQSLILSDEKKRTLESELSKKETELNDFVDKIYGREGQLVSENEKISEPIIKQIRKTINDVAIEEGYDMVLDRASGAVIFWKSDHDLTQKVTDILNNNF
ncbi:MAG: OmpH family outer membrane protein [Fibrobacterales bacterium]